MKHQSSYRDPRRTCCWRLASGAALALLVSACGGAVVAPAAAVGKVGGNLSAHAQAVPQGGEVCALEQALKAPPGRAKKPVSEPCADAVKSDQLWGTSLATLAAYGEHIEAVASGTDPGTSGQLQAALTSARGPLPADVQDGAEQSAHNAVGQLIEQLANSTSESELEKIVTAAAPHVKAVCDGLEPYLSDQASRLAALQKQIPEVEVKPTSRRCAMLDNRPVCVGDSVVDRLVFADEFGHLAALQSSHQQARHAVAAFCAAHASLEQAAAAGNLSDDETGRKVVDAVKGAIPEQAAAEAAPEAGEADEGTATPPGGG